MATTGQLHAEPGASTVNDPNAGPATIAGHGGPAAAGAAPAAAAAPAVPAKRGGLFGRRGNKGEVAAAEAAGTRPGFSINKGASLGLLLAQLLTAIAFTIVLGGLSALQHDANNQSVPTILQGAYATQYNELFQSGNQVPYPLQGKRQFGLAWWILMFEIFIFMWIFILIVMPRHLLRMKHTAMAFLVYVMVLTTLQIDSLLYFSRSPLASNVYEPSHIKATLAGTIMGVFANGLSIIFLGLLRNKNDTVTGAGAHGKHVSPVAGPAAV